jgi:hypothetical protein
MMAVEDRWRASKPVAYETAQWLQPHGGSRPEIGKRCPVTKRRRVLPAKTRGKALIADFDSLHAEWHPATGALARTVRPRLLVVSAGYDSAPAIRSALLRSRHRLCVSLAESFEKPPGMATAGPSSCSKAATTRRYSQRASSRRSSASRSSVSKISL